MISGKPLQATDDEEEPVEEVLDLRKSCLSNPGKEKLCSWCGKRGISCPNGLVGSSTWTYCSQRCYEKFRRAVFKKRSACLWCSNVAGRASDTTAQSTLDETKFCSECCLTQFKLKLFCDETTSHLHQIKDKDSNVPASTGTAEVGTELITPALWLRKDSSPPWKETDVTFDPIPQGQRSKLDQNQQQATPGPSSTQVNLTKVKIEPIGQQQQPLQQQQPGSSCGFESPRREKRKNSMKTSICSSGTFGKLRISKANRVVSPGGKSGSMTRRKRDPMCEPYKPHGVIDLYHSKPLTPPPVNLSVIQNHQHRLDRPPRQATSAPLARTISAPSQQLPRNDSIQISLVPIPFPFLFPVILPPQISIHKTFDPIEDLE